MVQVPSGIGHLQNVGKRFAFKLTPLIVVFKPWISRRTAHSSSCAAWADLFRFAL
jgi:hypothetical protein